MKNNRSIIQLVALALLLALTCCRPKKDNDQKYPEDVVKSFVEAVNAGKFDRARAYWSDGSVANIERYFEMSFEKFCQKEFGCPDFRVESPVKQKGEYWSVVYISNCSEPSSNYLFYLAMIDGKYRITYDLWRAPDVD